MSIEEKISKGPSTKWFTFVTVAYLLVMMIGAWMLGFFDPKGTPITPSDWGSVLAGVFSPLAFLWLIYASLSQRAELELQREELRQNNITQREQQESMEKQARALNAQIDRLEVEATARYEPIIVVRSGSYLQSDQSITLSLKNVGGSVLNVSFSDDVALEHIVNENAEARSRIRRAGKIISYWETGEWILLGYPRDQATNDEFFMEIHMRRLDLKTITHTYRVVDNFQRVELIGRMVVPALGEEE